jgi:hypothetical protein
MSARKIAKLEDRLNRAGRLSLNLGFWLPILEAAAAHLALMKARPELEVALTSIENEIRGLRVWRPLCTLFACPLCAQRTQEDAEIDAALAAIRAALPGAGQ